MFKIFGKKKLNPSMVTTLIGPGTVIDGNVKFEGVLRVEGTIVGDATGLMNSMLVLVKGGRISGSVSATSALINGPIEGVIVTCDTLELQSEARLNGEITYKDLVIAKGAIITGSLKHVDSSNNEMKKPTIELDNQAVV